MSGEDLKRYLQKQDTHFHFLKIKTKSVLVLWLLLLNSHSCITSRATATYSKVQKGKQLVHSVNIQNDHPALHT